MISLQICKNSVAELQADPMSPGSWAPAPAHSRSCLIPPSLPGQGSGGSELGGTTYRIPVGAFAPPGCRWVLGAVGMSPLSWDCLQGTQARGGGKVQFGSSLSLNGLKIAVGKCTLSLYNLREVLSPPGPSLPTDTVNMTALQGDLWRFFIFYFLWQRE